jgi:hypothetical protein
MDLKMQEKVELVRRSDTELTKNKSLMANLFNYEAKYRAADEAIQTTNKEIDNLQVTNT